MKTALILAALLLFLSAPASMAQETEIDTSAYALSVDTPPEIVGGFAALSRNIEYPEQAKEKGVEGMVIVEILLSETGAADRLHVLKTDSPLLTEAALDAVRAVRFTPGMTGGKPVKTKIALPIKFALK